MCTLCSYVGAFHNCSAIPRLRAPHHGVFLPLSAPCIWPFKTTVPLDIIFPQSFSSDFKTLSFCQAWYEVPNFLGLEHTFQLRSRTILASCDRVGFVPINLGLLRCLPAQKAPPLTRPVRCRWYDGLIITILTFIRFFRRSHWWWRWVRVTLLPIWRSE